MYIQGGNARITAVVSWLCSHVKDTMVTRSHISGDTMRTRCFLSVKVSMTIPGQSWNYLQRRGGHIQRQVTSSKLVPSNSTAYSTHSVSCGSALWRNINVTANRSKLWIKCWCPYKIVDTPFMTIHRIAACFSSWNHWDAALSHEFRYFTYTVNLLRTLWYSVLESEQGCEACSYDTRCC